MRNYIQTKAPSLANSLFLPQPCYNAINYCTKKNSGRNDSVQVNVSKSEGFLLNLVVIKAESFSEKTVIIDYGYATPLRCKDMSQHISDKNRIFSIPVT